MRRQDVVVYVRNAAMQQKLGHMDHEQCVGLYARLHQELTLALAQRPGNDGMIDRLTDEMVQVERTMSDLCPIDEQCGERLFG